MNNAFTELMITDGQVAKPVKNTPHTGIKQSLFP